MHTFYASLKLWSSHFMRAGYFWWRRNHANEAAALAFYSLFSLIPILFIGLFVASVLVGKDTATASLLEQTTKVTGFSANNYLKQTLTREIQWIGNTFSPLLGGALLAFSATKVINELRRALSNIFGVPRYKKKRQAAFAMIAGRCISLLIIILLGFLIASAVIFESIMNTVKEYLPDSKYLVLCFNYISPFATFAATTLFATAIMKWLPKRPPKLQEAVIGSIICSLWIILLKYGLTIFLRHVNISDIFGGALTLVLLLLWIYLAMQAILYSAEFTAILAKERRAKEQPTSAPENACTLHPPEQ